MNVIARPELVIVMPATEHCAICRTSSSLEVAYWANSMHKNRQDLLQMSAAMNWERSIEGDRTSQWRYPRDWSKSVFVTLFMES